MKLQVPRSVYPAPTWFSAAAAAASLKLDEAVKVYNVDDEVFRGRGRGLIEAAVEQFGETAKFVVFRGRGRGLIEAQ